MLPVNYVIAAVLLSTPPEAPIPYNFTQDYQSVRASFARIPIAWGIHDAPRTIECLSPALRQVALAYEVMDPKEGPGKDRDGFVLADKGSFATDMEMLRRRWHRLRDAPWLFDHVRFPPREVIQHWLKLNREHKKLLEKRSEIEVVHRSWYRNALRETDRLYEVWDAIKETRTKHYFVHYRRGALKKVRDMIGPAAFYGGNFPPPVPYGQW